MCVNPYNSSIGHHFNSSIDNRGIIYSDILINNEDEGQDNIHIDNREIGNLFLQ